jgi:hypothetical protein
VSSLENKEHNRAIIRSRAAMKVFHQQHPTNLPTRRKKREKVSCLTQYEQLQTTQEETTLQALDHRYQPNKTPSALKISMKSVTNYKYLSGSLRARLPASVSIFLNSNVMNIQELLHYCKFLIARNHCTC